MYTEFDHLANGAITRKQCAKWVTIPHARPSRSSHDNSDSALGVIDSNW